TARGSVTRRRELVRSERFFFSSRRRHTSSASAFLLNRSSDLIILIANIRKLAAERPLKDIRDEYNYPKKKGIKDECSRLLEASTMKSRRSEERRVGKECRCGWGVYQ